MNADLNSTLKFLKQLAANNNTAWFHAHRDAYDAARDPFERLVEEVILKLSKYEDLGGVQPRDCMFRINRDVRFSPDKSPYKIAMSALIGRGGRKRTRAAYYLHLQPGASFLGGGIYAPEPENLNKLRRALAADAQSLRRILITPTFKKNFSGLDKQDMLKTAPKGFSADHPALDLLKFKHFTVGQQLADREVLTPDLPAHIVTVYRAMKPLNDWLNHALGE